MQPQDGQPVPSAPEQLEAGQQQQIPVTCPHIVYGQWKDNLFDFCSPGSRPSFWMALFGPCFWPCLIAKIASRVRFTPGCNWLGNTPFQQWLRLLSFVTAFMWMCWFMMARINGSIASLMWEDYQNHPAHKTGQMPQDFTPETKQKIKEAMMSLEVFDSLLYLIGILFTIVICFLRLRTRTKFDIPSMLDSPGQRPNAFSIVEDWCCAWFCACCTLAQMSRHTHAADDGCDPCTDPGPAETMEAPMVNMPQMHQMQVFSVQQQQPNSMYQPPVAVPVATAVTPVHTPGGVPQGRPVDAAHGDSTETAEVYDAKKSENV